MSDILSSVLVLFSDPIALIRFAGIYIFVIWISVVIWVIKDITNRTDSILLQVLSVMCVLIFTPLGIFVYLLIRPQSTLFERLYEREFRDLTANEGKELEGAQKVLQEQLVQNNEK